MNREIELETSDALLDIGVSIPICILKLPFSKRKIRLRATMKRPCLGNQIEIARKYLSLGTSYEKMKLFTKEEEMSFLANHGKTVSEMIALTICRGKITGRFSGIMAWLLRWLVDDVFLMAANLQFVTLMGTKNFMNIIRSSEWSNPLKPRLSQNGKRS